MTTGQAWIELLQHAGPPASVHPSSMPTVIDVLHDEVRTLSRWVEQATEQRNALRSALATANQRLKLAGAMPVEVPK